MYAVRLVALWFLLLGVLSGCGEGPKPAPKVAVPPPMSGATPGSAADTMAPRYDATLAEGIDFRKPGYPAFVAEVSGVGAREDWGRWSEGPVSKLRFKDPLPRKFTLVMRAGAIGPNFGQPIIVRAGTVQRQFTVSGPIGPPPPGAEEFTIQFDGVDGADTIELVPPKPTRPKDMDPKSDDERMLGVGLVYLKVQK